MIRNFFKPLGRFLSRVSVFYQILFIIILMIGFMVVQSITGSKAMQMIQENSRKIYDTTAAISAQDSVDVEIEVERIRSQYLALLAREEVGKIPKEIQVDLNVLANQIKSRKNIDDATRKNWMKA
ncbi:MAG TPA: hypothetical protein VIL83_07305 [Capillibacterium sp.]